MCVFVCVCSTSGEEWRGRWRTCETASASSLTTPSLHWPDSSTEIQYIPSSLLFFSFFFLLSFPFPFVQSPFSLLFHFSFFFIGLSYCFVAFFNLFFLLFQFFCFVPFFIIGGEAAAGAYCQGNSVFPGHLMCLQVPQYP